MIAEFIGYLTPLAISAAFLLGLAWGLSPMRASVHLVLGAGLGAAFFLVIAGVRGMESPTPELSIPRTIGLLALWLVAIAGIAVGRRLRR